MKELTDLADLLSKHTFRYCSEKELQDGIGMLFDRSHVVYAREYRLTAKDRPDFLVVNATLGRIAMEIKTKGATASVLRQLERYAEHSDVVAVLLVTTRSLQALQVPDQMNSKPVRVVCLRSL